MNGNHNQKNREKRLTQAEQLRQLFFSLKTVAAAILLLGICFIGILSAIPIKPADEIIVLSLFGLVSGGFVIARARSILIRFESVIQKEVNPSYEKEKIRK